MNIFEQASITKLRFDSTRGDLTTEQLWDVPLSSKNGFSLDDIAKSVNRELKATAEESFVAPASSGASTKLQLQLEILKHIIAVKMDARDKASQAAERAVKKAKLLEVLAEKQDTSLRQLTVEELQEQIAALS